jgi:sporulation protein YlmC with PRC-barrel domain
MIRSLDSMLGSSVVATDGEIGKLYNVFFDDRSWAVRYLVVETGSWLMHRKVLISPAVLGRADWIANTIPMLLTKEQVHNGPDVDTDQPVSRQQQLAMIGHCGRPNDLSRESLPPAAVADAIEVTSEAAVEMGGDPHLRSAKEVAGYSVEAADGALGNIADFVVEYEGWGIPDLVIRIETPPKDRTMLVPTQWVSSVSWADRRVRLSQSREKFMSTGLLTEA